METPVKRILMGDAVEKVANRGAMRNPESLDYYFELAKQRKWIQSGQSKSGG